MIRLGRVDYINTFPIAWSLAGHLPAGLAEEVVGVPTALNALLHAGEVDVANVSSVEYARHAEDYVLLPSLCVGSDGAVESVQLVTDRRIDDVRTIAATAQSASSVVLARVLLPHATILPEDADADARLLIGDQALRSAFEDPTPHHDLGRLWLERTGQPMVFAVWAAPEPVADGLLELQEQLVASVRIARAEPEVLAREASDRYGYPAGFLARYFEKLRYSFGPREREGFLTFLRMAQEVGELDSVPKLRFVDQETEVTL